MYGRANLLLAASLMGYCEYAVRTGLLKHTIGGQTGDRLDEGLKSAKAPPDKGLANKGICHKEAPVYFASFH